MFTIVLFSQHLKIDSLIEVLHKKGIEDRILFLTTQFLFENEREQIEQEFSKVSFRCFADFLTDSDMEKCDVGAFEDISMPYDKYLKRMKRIKNEMVWQKIQREYPSHQGFIFSNDLGIDAGVWISHGFEPLLGLYYYRENNSLSIIKTVKNKLKKYQWIRNIYRVLIHKSSKRVENVYCAEYEGKKYIFIGRMNRIDYRLAIPFRFSETERDKFNRGEYESRETCQYLTTWHEHWKCHVPDYKVYDVRWIQDGYLPPNYTDYSYDFIPSNVQYYAWDSLGEKLFKNRNLPVSIIPFRKKLYMPEPIFPKKIKRVLIVASGSGDWTALKNRSDDDILVNAFAQMAKKFPEIDFVYRCHPTWIHPLNVGIHSIDRVKEYFDWLNLPNLHVSAHIPIQSKTGDFRLTFPRSSLEEDLKRADFVFGEHSISMIDAAFKRIPFASCNLTNRRNFFCGINELGFPCCTSQDSIEMLLMTNLNESFRKAYHIAVGNYNKMTDEEDA